MSRHTTTSMTQAASLHACGFDIVGARKLTAEEAREYRQQGDSYAREGSVAFEIDRGDDEQAFSDALTLAETQGGWVHAGLFQAGIQQCRDWIRQFERKPNTKRPAQREESPEVQMTAQEADNIMRHRPRGKLGGYER